MHRNQLMKPAVFVWFAEIEFVDGREQRARDLDENHGFAGYVFGMLVKPESRPLRSGPIHEKAKRTLTLRKLVKGYEFIGTAFEVDEFEVELSQVLEKFEVDMARLVSGDRKVTVRRGKNTP